MTEETLIILMLMLGFIGFPALIIVIISIQNICLSKYKQKYPELFNMIDELNKSTIKSCHFYNDNILKLRERIDSILSERKYMTR